MTNLGRSIREAWDALQEYYLTGRHRTIHDVVRRIAVKEIEKKLSEVANAELCYINLESDYVIISVNNEFVFTQKTSFVKEVGQIVMNDVHSFDGEFKMRWEYHQDIRTSRLLDYLMRDLEKAIIKYKEVVL